MSNHIPVLLKEAIESLAIKPDGVYIDGTFGRGGHSRAILACLAKDNSDAKLMVIDQDPNAIATATQLANNDGRLIVCHDNFCNIDKLAKQNQLTKVDGILLDLGVSSPQLDEAERGFSFSNDGPLDMRMDHSDNSTQQSAEQWLASAKENEIANVLWVYGEERYSRRIAKAIVIYRAQNKIKSTLQLADIIKQAHPNWPKNKHPATKSFMAIRLYINRELEVLEEVLSKSLSLLKTGGRLVIISFHSLEDRIVKQFINKHSRKINNDANSILNKLPLTDEQLSASVFSQNITLKVVQKPIKAGIMEVNSNVRARSAVLRVAAKV